MTREFVKMHGAGNDYIFFDCMSMSGSDPFLKDGYDLPALARRLSDRHFSIGGDGIVLVCPPSSARADAFMRMFNADGSEGKMCGNAIRCVGKLVYEKLSAEKGIKKPALNIETLSGEKHIILDIKGGRVVGAAVEMGHADFSPGAVPVLSETPVIDMPVKLGKSGTEWRITALSMGNPHCVVFVPETAELELNRIGPEFEGCLLFPDKTNTEFVRVISDRELEMRVWERGSGETLACGTGACASAAAAVRLGFCKKNTVTALRLRGGTLYITVRDDWSVLMKGPCETAFRGTAEC